MLSFMEKLEYTEKLSIVKSSIIIFIFTKTQ